MAYPIWSYMLTHFPTFCTDSIGGFQQCTHKCDSKATQSIAAKWVLC